MFVCGVCISMYVLWMVDAYRVLLHDTPVVVYVCTRVSMYTCMHVYAFIEDVGSPARHSGSCLYVYM